MRLSYYVVVGRKLRPITTYGTRSYREVILMSNLLKNFSLYSRENKTSRSNLRDVIDKDFALMELVNGLEPPTMCCW